jgi:hypothetical protein
VSSFLNSSSYDYENRLLPNDYIVIRDHGEGQEILGEGLGGMEDQQGRTSQEGDSNQLTSGLFLGFRSSLRKNGCPGHIQTRIWVILIWMEIKKISFQMEQVPCPNSSGVDGKIFQNLVSRICLSAAPLSLVLWAVYLVLAH